MPTKKPPLEKPWVDPDDAPKLDAAFFARANLYEDGKPVRHGRPATGNAKHLLSLRVDTETIERLRALGPGWQTRAVKALTEFAKQASS